MVDVPTRAEFDELKTALVNHNHSEHVHNHSQYALLHDHPYAVDGHSHDVVDNLGWAVGFGQEVNTTDQQIVNISNGDIDSLFGAAREGGNQLILPPNPVFAATDPGRGATLILGENTSIVCATHDALFLNINEGLPLGPNTLIEGVRLHGPDVRDPYRDGMDFYGPSSALMGNWVRANVSIGQWPDEAISIWGTDPWGSPGKGTFYRCHIERQLRHTSSTESNTHGLLMGYQRDRYGKALIKAQNMQVTDWECLFETDSRHPDIGYGALSHSVRSVRRDWGAAGGYSVLVKHNARFKADGAVWDGAGVDSTDLHSTYSIDPDENKRNGNEQIDVNGSRYLNGAFSNQLNTGDIEVPYEFPRGAMTDVEIAAVISRAGTK